ncbi:DUF4129 domain-containing protein [Rhizomonospora bruguierae]|uniref:DUF4129 domain-containing protein n=1 Tax=Rhizomonospora bruguierae TaxID=1581705 RepID=UPI0020BE5A99|nr:DUF4129 domain-containing protein [Micromonospora sp. NBRC 107566]
MSFSRWWTEALAALGDLMPLTLAAGGLLLLAALVGAAWYWYPAWVPRRLPRWRMPRLRRWRMPRLRRPRWRWPRLRLRLRWPFRRRRRPVPEQPVPTAPAEDELPDMPAVALRSLADDLAAQGRYAEAVRERLRGMVRELVERRVIEHRPGWTVTELARAATDARPGTDAALGEAGGIFSDIWYGQRAALDRHDQRMRELAEALHAILEPERVGR